MRTLDIGKLRQEREQLTKRIEQLDTLLAAEEAFKGTAPKKAGGPRVGVKCLPLDEREYDKLKKRDGRSSRLHKEVKANPFSGPAYLFLSGAYSNKATCILRT